MPTHMVNLDALIPREDFAVDDPQKEKPLEEGGKLKIVELEPGSVMYKWLRKPDFQRTTAQWPPKKVAAFIKSFLSGDLIPALIFWQSSTGGVFVIDGAHRLSALIAWVYDDYGDQALSLRFWDGAIPPEQKAAAADTRRLIAQTVGSYAEVKHGTNLSPERSGYSSNLAVGGITVQWVRGDASRAERSFHTINTEQTPIGDLEIRMIRDRRCPNAIAARSLISAGTGRYPPQSFSADTKGEIRSLSRSVYETLFVPPLETPIKTLDLPVAGRGYSSETIKLALDLVEFVNGRVAKQPGETAERAGTAGRPKPARRKRAEILAPTMPADLDGSETVAFLKGVRTAVRRIAGTGPESLGLHPAVYFYSATGAYQPAAFLAAIQLVSDLASGNRLNEFCLSRRKFEELLVRQKRLVNEVVRKFGSGLRSVGAVHNLFKHLLEGTQQGLNETDILPWLAEKDGMEFLLSVVDPAKGIKLDFTTARKSAAFLAEALQSAVRCGVCGARVHRASLHVDHAIDKKLGGRGSTNNAQIAHPYCDSAYKEWRRNVAAKAAARG